MQIASGPLKPHDEEDQMKYEEMTEEERTSRKNAWIMQAACKIVAKGQRFESGTSTQYIYVEKAVDESRWWLTQMKIGEEAGKWVLSYEQDLIGYDGRVVKCAVVGRHLVPDGYLSPKI